MIITAASFLVTLGWRKELSRQTNALKDMTKCGKNGYVGDSEEIILCIITFTSPVYREAFFQVSIRGRVETNSQGG